MMRTLAFFVLLSALCRAQHIEPMPLGEPQQVDVYRLNLEHEWDGGTSTLNGAELPHNALVEALYIVVDTAITECDSVAVDFEGGARLWSSGALSDGSLVAGDIVTAQPFTATGTAPARLQFTRYDEGAGKGQVRIFILWRRLF